MPWVRNEDIAVLARLAKILLKGNFSSASPSVLIGVRYMILCEMSVLEGKKYHNCISTTHDMPETLYFLKKQESMFFGKVLTISCQ